MPNIVLGSGIGFASASAILFLISTNLKLVALSNVREYTPEVYRRVVAALPLAIKLKLIAAGLKLLLVDKFK
ncbi:hypothetical protein [Microcoleus vaginatus]|uniref:hypothetical protein n=1 Tax=Microcoleus vaginatus TaxID=119532 RepID=UPI004040A333